MNTIMNDNHIKTLAQVRAFLEGTQTVEFSLHSKTERYDFVRRNLIRFAYHRLSKPDKGLLLSFMSHVSGYSRIQVKRLTRTWLKQGKLQPRSSASNGFAISDIAILSIVRAIIMGLANARFRVARSWT